MTQSLWRLFESNDIAEMDQLRVLVCDGAGLLAWVGGFRARPFTPQEKRRLQAVVPAMQRRFALQRQVGLSSLHLAALQASLDAIPRAAFVVSAKGRIVHANALATQALSADRASTFSAIQDSLGRRRWGGAQLALTEIVAPGVGTHYLAVQRQPRPDATARLPQAAQRWGLTRRQTEVLELLAGGLSNRVMAAALGCAEGTIQLHVAAVLAKVGAESRAEVVARFWTELG
ncbi:MAG: helix-turn-helix transcriptional regulator [Myxococcales bacterium]|nr:helix-turn-helix transcriptional regulator [Myxococcales bacterium]MCB9583622.1 helix-turn-helix transcriptional regulator [Polyangiaceae bacterium]